MKITVELDNIPQKIKSVNIEFFEDGTVGVVTRPAKLPDTFGVGYGIEPCGTVPADSEKYGWGKVNEVDVNSTNSDFEYDKILAKREKPSIIGNVGINKEDEGPDLSHIANREENIAGSMTEKF